MVSHGVASRNNAPVVLCGVRALYDIRACANGIRVFCALHSVVVVCNGHNDDGLVACNLHGEVAYAPHSAVVCAPRSVAVYAPRSAVACVLRNAVSYAHHSMVCALHDVMDNELDPMVFRMCRVMEPVMLTQSPGMPQKLSAIQRVTEMNYKQNRRKFVWEKTQRW